MFLLRTFLHLRRDCEYIAKDLFDDDRLICQNDALIPEDPNIKLRLRVTFKVRRAYSSLSFGSYGSRGSLIITLWANSLGKVMDFFQWGLLRVGNSYCDAPHDQ